jgi:hypothetical protein
MLLITCQKKIFYKIIESLDVVIGGKIKNLFSKEFKSSWLPMLK